MNKPFIKILTGIVLLISTTILVCNSANPEEPTGKEISVVLDPVFGGTETGAVGSYKLAEKEVVLDVALRVKDYIEKNNTGIKIYLTRTKDESVSQKEREKFIQSHSSALVVGLRMNSSAKKDASGFSVRYDRKSKESKKLAEIISAEISDRFIKGLVPNEGIKPAEIYKNIQVSTVEVFLGYITNPNIEANFRQPGVKEAFAESIGRAIAQYLDGGRDGKKNN
ncbi:MAG: N-acetylmuramoyl-L-alanine amidase [Candidatus Ratteibacteria bacterium]